MRKELKGLVIFFGLIFLLPLLVKSPYYIGVLVFWGIYSIITLGLTILMGYAGQISLGQAGFFAVGAYTSGILTTRFGLPPWLGILAGLGLSLLLSLFLALPSLKLKGHYLAMATLGFGEIVHVVLNAWVGVTGGPSGFGEIPALSFLGWKLDSEMSFFYFTWGWVFLFFLFSLSLLKSPYGRALRSLHAEERIPLSLGVNVYFYKVFAFLWAAFYASFAGSLYAHFMTFLSPSSFTLILSILLVLMIVVGGLGNLWGALLGAGILTFLPEILRTFEDFEMLIYGTFLILVMIFLPKGLVSLRRGKVATGD